MVWLRVIVIQALYVAALLLFLTNPYVQKLSPTSVDWTWPPNCYRANLNGYWGDHFVCAENREKI